MAQEMIKYNDKEYSLAFNLNVVDDLQDKWGSFDTWLEKLADSDIKFIKDIVMYCVNEAIDIKNEEEGTKEKKITSRMAGRMATMFLNPQNLIKLSDMMIYSIMDENEEEPKN